MGWTQQHNITNYTCSLCTIYSLAIGDADNDGENEIVIGGNNRVGELAMYKNESGTWIKHKIASSVGAPNKIPGGIEELAIGDADNDGKNEIVIGLGWDINALDVENELRMYKNESGTWKEHNISDTEGIFSVAIGDADNDGENEIIISNDLSGDYEIQMYKNESGTWNKHGILDILVPTIDLAIGDADNDGNNEVVIVFGATATINGTRMMKNESGTWTQHVVGYENKSNNIESVAIGDADNDGNNEVVIGIINDLNFITPLRMYKNESGTWSRHFIGFYSDMHGIYFHSLAIGDADNDGNNEVVVGTAVSNGISMYKNESGDWSRHVIQSFASSTNVDGLVIGDALIIGEGGDGGDDPPIGEEDEIPPVTTCDSDEKFHNLPYTINLTCEDPPPNPSGCGKTYWCDPRIMQCFEEDPPVAIPFVPESYDPVEVKIDFYSCDKSHNCEQSKSCNVKLEKCYIGEKLDPDLGCVFDLDVCLNRCESYGYLDGYALKSGEYLRCGCYYQEQTLIENNFVTPTNGTSDTRFSFSTWTLHNANRRYLIELPPGILNPLHNITVKMTQGMKLPRTLLETINPVDLKHEVSSRMIQKADNSFGDFGETFADVSDWLVNCEDQEYKCDPKTGKCWWIAWYCPNSNFTTDGIVGKMSVDCRYAGDWYSYYTGVPDNEYRYMDIITHSGDNVDKESSFIKAGSNKFYFDELEFEFNSGEVGTIDYTFALSDSDFDKVELYLACDGPGKAEAEYYSLKLYSSIPDTAGQWPKSDREGWLLCRGVTQEEPEMKPSGGRGVQSNLRVPSVQCRLPVWVYDAGGVETKNSVTLRQGDSDQRTIIFSSRTGRQVDSLDSEGLYYVFLLDINKGVKVDIADDLIAVPGAVQIRLGEIFPVVDDVKINITTIGFLENGLNINFFSGYNSRSTREIETTCSINDPDPYESENSCSRTHQAGRESCSISGNLTCGDNPTVYCTAKDTFYSNIKHPSTENKKFEPGKTKEVCEACGGKWGEQGWKGDIAEDDSCCGDQENEHVIEGLNETACCDEPTDCVHNGKCYNEDESVVIGNREYFCTSQGFSDKMPGDLEDIFGELRIVKTVSEKRVVKPGEQVTLTTTICNSHDSQTIRKDSSLEVNEKSVNADVLGSYFINDIEPNKCGDLIWRIVVPSEVYVFDPIPEIKFRFGGSRVTLYPAYPIMNVTASTEVVTSGPADFFVQGKWYKESNLKKVPVSKGAYNIYNSEGSKTHHSLLTDIPEQGKTFTLSPADMHLGHDSYVFETEATYYSYRGTGVTRIVRTGAVQR
jgi:hypothetical protein